MVATARVSSSSPAAIPAPPVETLRRGSRGKAVLALQKALVTLGHLSRAEMSTGPGIFGPRTESAVKELQQRHRLPADGVYGPATHRALASALRRRAEPKPAPAGASKAAPRQSLQKGSRGPAVKQLQTALVKLGHLTAAEMATGPGIFGPRTEGAVKELQQRWRIRADGVYGPRTRAALDKALRGGKPPAGAGGAGPVSPVQSGPLAKPAVVARPSPNFNSRGGKDIDTIVLHHTASNSDAAGLATLRSPAAQVSAHYMIGRDGTIYQLVDDSKRAWHAGSSALHGVPTDVNSRSIGIEITNAGDGRTPYTQAQYRALERLVPYLAAKYKVPLNNLVGHKDVAVPRGRKSDPSANFDFDRIRAAVRRVA